MLKGDGREYSGFNPLALTLAIWLGCVVSVAGVTRLAQDASDRAVLRTLLEPVGGAPLIEASQPAVPQMIASGGP